MLASSLTPSKVLQSKDGNISSLFSPGLTRKSLLTPKKTSLLTSKPAEGKAVSFIQESLNQADRLVLVPTTQNHLHLTNPTPFPVALIQQNTPHSNTHPIALTRLVSIPKPERSMHLSGMVLGLRKLAKTLLSG